LSIVKIKEVCLCTGLTKDNNENRSAYDFLKENNIDFVHLAYWDPGQHDNVFSSLQTWDTTKKVDRFPIVHYHTIDENYDMKTVVLVGLDELKKSNIVSLSKL
jgi:hypothetical protein